MIRVVLWIQDPDPQHCFLKCLNLFDADPRIFCFMIRRLGMKKFGSRTSKYYNNLGTVLRI
jgi:hypothetical protein